MNCSYCNHSLGSDHALGCRWGGVVTIASTGSYEMFCRVAQGVENLNTTFDRMEAAQAKTSALQSKMVRRNIAINVILIVMMLLLVLVNAVNFYKRR